MFVGFLDGINDESVVGGVSAYATLLLEAGWPLIDHCQSEG